MGAREHIWRVSCGPRVFGNSLRSAASVDFIILIARHENISKHTFIYSRSRRRRVGGEWGWGWGDAQESNSKKRHATADGQFPHARPLPWDRCLRVWSLVITASANYLETRRHHKRGYNGGVFDNYRTFDETSATSTPNIIKISNDSS